jgi:hypothetical protein
MCRNLFPILQELVRLCKLCKDLYISAYVLIIYLCSVLGSKEQKVRLLTKGSDIGGRISGTYFRKPIHIEKLLSEKLPLRIAISCCCCCCDLPWEQ